MTTFFRLTLFFANGSQSVHYFWTPRLVEEAVTFVRDNGGMALVEIIRAVRS